MSSTFERPSSSSEDEFYDACSGDEDEMDRNDSRSPKLDKSIAKSTIKDNQLIKTNETSITNVTADVFIQPKAPPRKKKIKKVNSFNDGQSANDHLRIDNLTDCVDDIASIQGNNVLYYCFRTKKEPTFFF